MIRTTTYPIPVFPVRAPRRAVRPADLPRLAGVAVLALLAAIGAATIALTAALSLIFVVLSRTPTDVAVSVPDQARDLPLEAGFGVRPSGWAARLEGATLWETSLEGGAEAPV